MRSRDIIDSCGPESGIDGLLHVDKSWIDDSFVPSVDLSLLRAGGAPMIPPSRNLICTDGGVAGGLGEVWAAAVDSVLVKRRASEG